MHKKESENHIAKLWIDENQIFNIQYHQGTVINLEAAKFIVNERIKLCNGKGHLIIVDGRGLKQVAKPALKYFSSEEGIKCVIAVSFLVDSFLNKMLGNYYLKMVPPKVPTSLFTKKEDALKWLNKFQRPL